MHLHFLYHHLVLAPTLSLLPKALVQPDHQYRHQSHEKLGQEIWSLNFNARNMIQEQVEISYLHYLGYSNSFSYSFLWLTTVKLSLSKLICSNWWELASWREMRRVVALRSATEPLEGNQFIWAKTSEPALSLKPIPTSKLDQFMNMLQFILHIK